MRRKEGSPRMSRRAQARQDLREFLAERKQAVERALGRAMPAAETGRGRLHEAMRYCVFSGGKRLRPILTTATRELLGKTAEGAMVPACAVELVHTYSLVHDDLPAMDDDELRRGRPTCHVVYGEGLAVLVGDALLTLAFELVAADDSLDPAVRVAIVRELAEASGSLGMVGGQAADLANERREPSREAIDFIHTRKTGMPIRAAVRIGAMTAGADARDLDALSDYGAKIGLAFQIVDDLLDLSGTPEKTGKAVRKDDRSGKMTYPGVHGEAEAGRRAEELVEAATEAIARFGESAWFLREIARFIVERQS